MSTTTNFTWPYPDPPDPANVPGDMGGLANAIDASVGNAWTSYTPSWTSSTVAPSIGNGTITGAFRRFGKWGVFRIHMTFGGTTSFGTGFYSLSLPAGWSAAAANQVIVAYLDDATQRTRGCARVVTTTVDRIFFTDASSGWTSTTPVTLASGDQAHFTGMIELA